jgi:hypothetical protein
MAGIALPEAGVDRARNVVAAVQDRPCALKGNHPQVRIRGSSNIGGYPGRIKADHDSEAEE